MNKNEILCGYEDERCWYTIEELASLCGFTDSHSMQSNPKILELLNQFSNSNDIKKGGYHNLKCFYSENVLRALKEYQLKNAVPNATKNKEVALEGNASFIQQETVKQTITSLMDNPETLQLLLTESLARQQSLQIENKMMKDVIAEQKPKVDYVDSYCDSTNLEEIGHLGKVTKIGEQKIFKKLLDDGYIKVRYSTDGVKFYDPCFGYERYFETIHVPFIKGDKRLSRDKLMLNHDGFMYFRKRYAA